MRRRVLRAVGVLGLVLLLAVAGVYGWALMATDTSGIARSIVWLESDLGDIDRFPSRPVPAGDRVRPLTPAPIPDDVLATIDVGGAEEHLDAVLERTGTRALLVLHGDEVLVERYLGGTGPDTLHTSFSAAKSVVSTLIGIAGARGDLDVDDPITRWLPELEARDPRFADIAIRHLIDMTSGISYVEQGMPWSDDAVTYYATDLRAEALDVTIAEPPGQRFHYNNFNLLLEGLILERATGQRIADLLAEDIWQPMGAEADASWSLDSEAAGFEKMESGINAVARDLARFGLLFLDGGRALGEQVVPADWVAEATAVEGHDAGTRGYQHHWWVDEATGRFSARGKYGQVILVDPAADLVVVRLGEGSDDVRWPQVLHGIADRVAAHLGR